MTNQSFEATIQYAHAAIRGSFLLNGGSCIALLAFLGNEAVIEYCKDSACTLSTALAYFAYGALFAIATSALSYFSQGSENAGKENWYLFFRAIAVAVYIFSLILFILGISNASSNLANFGI